MVSPYALHSPPGSTVVSPPPPMAISPSMFYAPPPAPQGPTPEQLKEKFLTGLKPLLQPNSFTGAGAIAKLASHIENYGVLKVDVPTRLEVLTKIRDNAGNHYFRAWAESSPAMHVTKKWLNDSLSENDVALAATTMPLLHVRSAFGLPVRVVLGREAHSPKITDLRSVANDYRVSEGVGHRQGCEARLKVDLSKFW